MGIKLTLFWIKPTIPLLHIFYKNKWSMLIFACKLRNLKRALFSALGFDLKKLKLRVNQTRSSFPMGTALDGSKISRCWTNGNDDKVTINYGINFFKANMSVFALRTCIFSKIRYAVILLCKCIFF